jgi:hypothetical protein
MTLTTWIIDILLILLVLRQVRVRPLTTRMVVLPTILVVWAFVTYFKGFTLNRADFELIAFFTIIGIALGVASGLLTKVWKGQQHILCQATVMAAVAWIAGMGFRLGFQLWADTKSGANWIVRFSIHHHINSQQAWVCALLLMALGEVMARVGILQWRLFSLQRKSDGQGAQPVYS